MAHWIDDLARRLAGRTASGQTAGTEAGTPPETPDELSRRQFVKGSAAAVAGLGAAAYVKPSLRALGVPGAHAQVSPPPPPTGCTSNENCGNCSTCVRGTCVPLVCDPLEDPCKVNVCNPSTGNCEVGNAANDTSCNDNNACTTGDTCQNGTCTGTAITCPENPNPCKVNICDPATGCVEQNTNERGLCGTQPTNSCQQNVCRSGACTTENKSNGTTCDTSNQCTADTCQGGVCTQGPVSVTCPTCQTCNPANGTCGAVAVGTTCGSSGSGQVCCAAPRVGMCRLPNGASCTGNGSCCSNNCSGSPRVCRP
jgi:hypothetical protein